MSAWWEVGLLTASQTSFFGSFAALIFDGGFHFTCGESVGHDNCAPEFCSVGVTRFKAGIESVFETLRSELFLVGGLVVIQCHDDQSSNRNFNSSQKRGSTSRI